MKIQTLIATMYREDLSFLEKMNIKNNYVVINQTDFVKFPKFDNLNEDPSRIVLSNQERGLSKSRNLAISNSFSDICLVSDDDIVFVDGFEDKIRKMYEDLPEADIIIYDYSTSDKKRQCKRLGFSPKKLRLIDLLKVSSVRISFKREKIENNNIKFNELFGAGSTFPSGEENLFLKDCFNSRLKIYYYPLVICDVDFEESSWFNGFDEQYFQGKGALSYAFWGKIYHLYNLYFVISKYKLYHKNLSIIAALKNMYKGKIKFEQIIKNGE